MHPEIAYQIATRRVAENSRIAVERGLLGRRRWSWRRRTDVALAPPRRLTPRLPEREHAEGRAA